MSEPYIITENSPPETASVVQLLRHATGVTIGALVGLQAATGPLLFVTVPAGIIIMGAAAGIGRGLEDGLRERIGNWLGGHKPRKRPTSGRSSSSRTA